MNIKRLLTMVTVITCLAILSSIGMAQDDRGIVNVRYGLTTLPTFEVEPGSQMTLDVFAWMDDTVWVADCLFNLGTWDMYIDSVILEQSSFTYPFTEWDLGEFSGPWIGDPIPDGWTCTSFLGICNIVDENPWFHYTAGFNIIDYRLQIASSDYIIGDFVYACGPVQNPFQGFDNAGDTLGYAGYQVVSTWAPFLILGGGYVDGTVIDSLTQLPIADVMITDDITGKIVYTDTDGFYQIGLIPGAHEFTFEHPEHPVHVETGINITEDNTLHLNVTLDSYGGIEGTVTHMYSGAPIQNVFVKIDGTVMAVTNAQGHYEILDMESDLYDLTFAKTGYDSVVVTDVEVTLNNIIVVDTMMDDFIGIDEDITTIPSTYSLNQNYPNPFNANTHIEYALPNDAQVSLDIYDMLGRKVASLVNEYQTAGTHSATWNASNFTSGTYFYRLQANDFVQQKAMILLK